MAEKTKLMETIQRLKNTNSLLEKQKSDILKNDVSQAYKVLQRKHQVLEEDKETLENNLKKIEAKAADYHRQVAQLQRRLNAVK